MTVNFINNHMGSFDQILAWENTHPMQKIYLWPNKNSFIFANRIKVDWKDRKL